MKTQKLALRRIFSVIGFCAIVSLARGQTFELLQATVYPGRYPLAAFVLGADGALYGNTYRGGTNSAGWVFKVRTDGTVGDVASFGSQNGSGAHPETAMILAHDGNFYGGTLYDTIYEMTPDGIFTHLFSFGPFSQGSQPNELMQASDGYLYGTTYYGGIYGDPQHTAGDGTAFKISTNGEFTQLFSFDGTNGIAPYGPLIQGKDGYLYGTTQQSKVGHGTVFKMTTNGLLATLATFMGDLEPKGYAPAGALLPIGDDAFYGTTQVGGALGGGTVYRITTNGILTTIASLDPTNDGGGLNGVVQAIDGNFYGTCSGGGTWDYGTVFKMTPIGGVTKIFDFGPFFDGPQGVYPEARLAEGVDGNLYGTCYEGGSGGEGTIFRIVIPRPRLNVARAGDKVVLSWPTNYATLHLQSTPDLNSVNWTNCSTATISGTNYTFTNSISGKQFFRLIR